MDLIAPSLNCNGKGLAMALTMSGANDRFATSGKNLDEMNSFCQKRAGQLHAMALHCPSFLVSGHHLGQMSHFGMKHQTIWGNFAPHWAHCQKCTF